MPNRDKFVAIPNEELGVDKDSLKKSFVDHILHTQGKHPTAATPFDQYMSAARTARDRMADRWTRTWHKFKQEKPKRVYYLSMEFLLGRLMEDGLINLGVHGATQSALAEVGLDLEEVVEKEVDPGLGNGGLGRLAACFVDSMATLGIAGMGYGIRYEFGIFRQDIIEGAQVETPDNWLRRGCPWEMARPERTFQVHFGGRVIHYTGPRGRVESDWTDSSIVMAMAYDLPVVGYRNGVINALRLWSAKAARDFDIHEFNRGDYLKSVEERSYSENISRVLYPNDTTEAGQELRLKQEYFLVSATLQDALHRHLEDHASLNDLPDYAVFQLNDTHPALAVAEMMRLLFDVHRLDWEEAWSITTRSLNYTNHTILPEALERWPVYLMERLLPRHLEIIYEINHRFLTEVRKRFPNDEDRIRRMSIIEEGDVKKVRMANLAIVGSSHVNGVSALHSKILKDSLFADFEALTPGKVINQTNGVTPRRWMLKCNPQLAELITSRIGDAWVKDLDQLEKLIPHAEDPAFRLAWRHVKLHNKEHLASFFKSHYDIVLDTNHLFDTQVKRIHEYKRQLLNIIHVVSLYLKYRSGKTAGAVPRTFLIGGKAAPGYDMAKRVIHLANSVGQIINQDVNTRDLLRLYFVPNYSVSLAERVIPASDLSEQISTAGTEASGTGNMKFAMNGALTIGTLDGANIEILEAVGWDNMFIFGLTAENVEHTKRQGYKPMDVYLADRELRAALDAISGGMFSPDDAGRFRPVVDKLLWEDPYLVLADYKGYALCQRAVDEAYRDQESWTRKAILNVANMGRFSSDNTIRGYARDIWGVKIP
ncbi:MAG: glycogen/starch/alpha-glucan phosphorylase [Polyangiaceae bacterium]